MNAGWPTLTYSQRYFDYIDFDWHSGTWEFSPEGVVRFGHEGDGFGAWVHGFIVPGVVG
jgi:hypothetical protein